ncbi:hypothetical protein [Saliterribacillus persicus]|uniref:Uncharacterized protein n=1 Tax=Saliterribacillus persicus TaxID=930114 RepID=A0A368XYZ0_9BACI|nr:hypothetical protein [Saliterribacillus persicus]RCW73203.1 hypothetical protein DFR57_104201 [Saliterribacillus persicus]
MFFKANPKADKTSVNIAFYSTFIFWSGFLLLNSILDPFNKSIPIDSLTLLLSGLAVFFLSEIVARFFRKRKGRTPN